MDTSETYMRMCQKAEEIQKLRGKGKWQEWDYVSSSYCEERYASRIMVVSGYTTDSGFYGLEVGSKDFPEDEFVPDDAIWLPRQDQLQEMVKRENYNSTMQDGVLLLASLMVVWAKDNWKEVLGMSMEQLWLAFVMKKKYGKIWDGEKWITA